MWRHFTLWAVMIIEVKIGISHEKDFLLKAGNVSCCEGFQTGNILNLSVSQRKHVAVAEDTLVCLENWGLRPHVLLFFFQLVNFIVIVKHIAYVSYFADYVMVYELKFILCQLSHCILLKWRPCVLSAGQWSMGSYLILFCACDIKNSFFTFFLVDTSTLTYGIYFSSS